MNLSSWWSCLWLLCVLICELALPPNSNSTLIGLWTFPSLPVLSGVWGRGLGFFASAPASSTCPFDSHACFLFFRKCLRTFHCETLGRLIHELDGKCFVVALFQENSSQKSSEMVSWKFLSKIMKTWKSRCLTYWDHVDELCMLNVYSIYLLAYLGAVVALWELSRWKLGNWYKKHYGSIWLVTSVKAQLNCDKFSVKAKNSKVQQCIWVCFFESIFWVYPYLVHFPTEWNPN